MFALPYAMPAKLPAFVLWSRYPFPLHSRQDVAAYIYTVPGEGVRFSVRIFPHESENGTFLGWDVAIVGPPEAPNSVMYLNREGNLTMVMNKAYFSSPAAAYTAMKAYWKRPHQRI